MNFEFRLNGTTKLVISPTTNLEREFFNELFGGITEVEVSAVPNSVNNQEIMITKKVTKED